MTLANFHPAARPQERAASGHGTTGRLVGAGMLVLGGLAAEMRGDAATLLFAAGLILLLGLPHGASDHLAAMRGRTLRAAPGRFASFLALYLGALGATLLLWRAAPGATLGGFLALSAIHFALDDVADEPWHARPIERVARGLMPVTLPALFHADVVAELFSALSTPQAGLALARLAESSAPFVFALAALAAMQRLVRGEREPAVEIALGAAALAVFTPLVGFALVFALVHSRGQTRERMEILRLPGLGTYLRACAPTLGGAALLFAGLGALYAGGRAPALGPLFVGLAALTVPHMLVTPLFARRP